MAELAIPIIALGSMYVLSNQNKNKNKNKNKTGTEPENENENCDSDSNLTEGFINRRHPNPLHPINYPVENNNLDDNINRYDNPNQHTDKYFMSQGGHSKNNSTICSAISSDNNQNYSLMGNNTVIDDLKHNNMVPFFGGSIKGLTYKENDQSSELVLDRHQGSGSQMKAKTEQAPLFNPNTELHNVYGMPNNTSTLQERYTPGTLMTNQLPFEQVSVARGLNQGYACEGSGGFNTSLEARETYMPQTVDEMRVDSNPKLSHTLCGHEGPGNSAIKDISTKKSIGQVEKYRPDTYYNSGPEKWFTTTGAEKGEMLRPEQIMPDVNRTTTSTEYYGSGNNLEYKKKPYVKSEYEESKKQMLGEYQFTPAYAAEQYNATDSDYGSKSYNMLQNNRTTTKKQSEYGVVSGIVNAIVTPVLDVLRPSRKENVIGNIRLLGNATTDVPNNIVTNPADRARTTIREMTGYKLDNNHLNVERQKDPGHVVTNFLPVEVQRDTTSTAYAGVAGPAVAANIPTYDNAYNMQQNNTAREYENRPNHGGTQIFNSRDNISIKRNDEDRVTHSSSMRISGPTALPTVQTQGMGKNTQQYNEKKIGIDRINPDILDAYKKNPYTQSLSSN